MTNSGVPDTVVDFWHGHEIGEMVKAYKSVQFESLKKMYLEMEHLLSISAKRLDEKELESRVLAKVDERVQAMQRIITNYAAENQDLRYRIQIAEKKLADLEKLIREALEQDS